MIQERKGGISFFEEAKNSSFSFPFFSFFLQKGGTFPGRGIRSYHEAKLFHGQVKFIHRGGGGGGGGSPPPGISFPP